jgi:Na+-driven multidrug efflux pump
MMLEMAMESVFALVDLYFVGHLKESGFAIQTVGLTESVLSVMYSIAIGMSMAATAVVARRVGRKIPNRLPEVQRRFVGLFCHYFSIESAWSDLR